LSGTALGDGPPNVLHAGPGLNKTGLAVEDAVVGLVQTIPAEGDRALCPAGGPEISAFQASDRVGPTARVVSAVDDVDVGGVGDAVAVGVAVLQDAAVLDLDVSSNQVEAAARQETNPAVDDGQAGEGVGFPGLTEFGKTGPADDQPLWSVDAVGDLPADSDGAREDRARVDRQVAVEREVGPELVSLVDAARRDIFEHVEVRVVRAVVEDEGAGAAGSGSDGEF
jgi:hypothetical protein